MHGLNVAIGRVTDVARRMLGSAPDFVGNVRLGHRRIHCGSRPSHVTLLHPVCPPVVSKTIGRFIGGQVPGAIMPPQTAIYAVRAPNRDPALSHHSCGTNLVRSITRDTLGAARKNRRFDRRRRPDLLDYWCWSDSRLCVLNGAQESEEISDGMDTSETS